MLGKCRKNEAIKICPIHIARGNTCVGCDLWSEAAKQLRVVVISPIKVTIDEGTHSDQRIRFVNGCNMGENCQNPDCWFGAVIREQKRAESRERKIREHE